MGIPVSPARMCTDRSPPSFPPSLPERLIPGPRPHRNRRAARAHHGSRARARPLRDLLRRRVSVRDSFSRARWERALEPEPGRALARPRSGFCAAPSTISADPTRRYFGPALPPSALALAVLRPPSTFLAFLLRRSRCPGPMFHAAGWRPAPRRVPVRSRTALAGLQVSETRTRGLGLRDGCGRHGTTPLSAISSPWIPYWKGSDGARRGRARPRVPAAVRRVRRKRRRWSFRRATRPAAVAWLPGGQTPATPTGATDFDELLISQEARESRADAFRACASQARWLSTPTLGPRVELIPQRSVTRVWRAGWDLGPANVTLADGFPASPVAEN
jgi:hypothetical protein